MQCLCQKIDRDDPHAMELDQLVLLHYLDQKWIKRKLNVMEKVVGSWKDLGRRFKFDVNRIAKNHNMGVDYATECFWEVLEKWSSVGQAGDYLFSWNGLIRALRDIDLNRIAGDIDIALNCVCEDS